MNLKEMCKMMGSRQDFVIDKANGCFVYRVSDYRLTVYYCTDLQKDVNVLCLIVSRDIETLYKNYSTVIPVQLIITAIDILYGGE